MRFGFPRNALVFASVAVASTFWLLLEVALDAAAFDSTNGHPHNASVFTDLPRIHERYLIYLVPFFLVALFAAIGLRRPGFPALRHLVGVAVVAALLPALIPFGTVVNGTSAIDSFALQLFGTTKRRPDRPCRARDHAGRRPLGTSGSRLRSRRHAAAPADCRRW